MTLPSFKRIVSASTGTVTVKASANATKARAKNFFVLTSKPGTVVEFVSRGEQWRKKRRRAPALGESRGKVAEPSVIKNSARLPLVFLSGSLPQLIACVLELDT